MRATSVEYGRVVNLGNFESLRLAVTIQLDEGDSFEEGTREAHRQVHEQIEQMLGNKRASQPEKDLPF